MKKKYVVSSKNKKDWIDFTNQVGTINPKEEDFLEDNSKKNIVPKLDLHGLSLDKSKEIVKKFILESFDRGYKKLLIITGKGLRSKSYDNPYVSEQLSVLRYAVPEFISNDTNLNEKVIKISTADIKDGGEGAIYIFLKKNFLKNKF